MPIGGGKFVIYETLCYANSGTWRQCVHDPYQYCNGNLLMEECLGWDDLQTNRLFTRESCGI